MYDIWDIVINIVVISISSLYDIVMIFGYIWTHWNLSLHDAPFGIGTNFPGLPFDTLSWSRHFAVFGEAQLGRWLTSLAAEFGIWCAILLRRSAQKTREVAQCSIPTEIQCPSWSRTSNWTFSAVSCKQDFTNHMKKKLEFFIGVPPSPGAPVLSWSIFSQLKGRWLGDFCRHFVEDIGTSEFLKAANPDVKRGGEFPERTLING